ncbi:MAG: multidrug effflux MFS transporter [Bacteriovorax sp.]|nr:multidrug effflux MFS transporter [Bacteriovorax sp.]
MNQNAKPTHESIPFIILLGSLTAFDPLSIDMYLPAFPQISKTFSVGASAVELSLSAFFIGLALGQLIYGPLTDIYGRKKPLIIGMLIYFAASIGCFLSPNIQIFIGFRILQALGGCSGMVITRAIVSDLYDKKRAAHIYSMLMLVMGIAPILAPFLGGLVSKYFGWPAIFAVLAILSLISTICTIFFLPETHRPSTTSTRSVLGYLDLFKDKVFMSYSLSGGLMRAAMFAYIAGSPFVFINLFKVPAEKYGLIFGANALGIIGAAQINRLLLKHYALEKIYQQIILVAGLIAVILLINSVFVHSIYALLIPLFLFMTSMGFIFPNSAALALANQGHRAGMASALLGTLQWSIAFFSSFFVSYFNNGTPIPMAGVIFVSTILAIICLLPIMKAKHEN